LLTSRAHSRPENPPCYHGAPYPGFYLGALGGPLGTKSWLDLRRQEDYDGPSFLADINTGLLKLVRSVSRSMPCPLLQRVTAAQDTTRQQENVIRDQRAALGCP
jgi:hypothetical protein